MKEIIDNSLINEIEEEEEEEEEGNFYNSTSDLFEIDHHGGGEVEGSLFSFDFHNHEEHDVVYVVVWNKNVSQEESSMDALLWTLNHVVTNPNSTIVFLIHIFPQTNFIPTPCKSSLTHTHTKRIIRKDIFNS